MHGSRPRGRDTGRTTRQHRAPGHPPSGSWAAVLCPNSCLITWGLCHRFSVTLGADRGGSVGMLSFTLC